MPGKATVYFLDLDDTLFPTSDLHNLGEEFERWRGAVKALLEKMAIVSVVTMASRPWVDEVRALSPVMAALPIFSCPEHGCSKEDAFTEIFSKIQTATSCRLSVVSVGDMPNDVHQCAAAFKRLKTPGTTFTGVKFLCRPTATTLCDELELLEESLECISLGRRSLWTVQSCS